MALVFTDTGAACVLGGYPGVALLDASGAQAAQASRTLRGYLGGLPPGTPVPPTIILTTGTSASAGLESTAVGLDEPTCPTYLGGLLVTPPGAVDPVHLPGSLSGCDFEVHPLVPGTGGGVAG